MEPPTIKRGTRVDGVTEALPTMKRGTRVDGVMEAPMVKRGIKVDGVMEAPTVKRGTRVDGVMEAPPTVKRGTRGDGVTPPVIKRETHKVGFFFGVQLDPVSQCAQYHPSLLFIRENFMRMFVQQSYSGLIITLLLFTCFPPLSFTSVFTHCSSGVMWWLGLLLYCIRSVPFDPSDLFAHVES